MARSVSAYVCPLLAAMVLCSFALAQDVKDREYIVGIDDILGVTSHRHQEISGEFPVESDGSITFPLLDHVAVAGRSVADIAGELEALLEKDFYVDVQLAVEVAQYLSKPVTISGEVRSPGTYYLRGETSLATLIADAGGLTPDAGDFVEVRRIDDGAEKVFRFPTQDALAGRGTIQLDKGDILIVQEKDDSRFFVTGEVSKPGQYTFSSGLTLMRAISEAGGLGKFASQKIEIHRQVNGEKRILAFDLARIRRGKEDDPPIEEDDIIYIRQRMF